MPAARLRPAMTVIGIVGLPGSGKSEAANVAAEMDVPVVTMGDVIREECRDRGLDPATDHGTVAKTLREEKASRHRRASLPMIEAELESNDTVLVDGIRSDVEVEAFDGVRRPFLLVEIDAPLNCEPRLDSRTGHRSGRRWPVARGPRRSGTRVRDGRGHGAGRRDYREHGDAGRVPADRSHTDRDGPEALNQ